MEYPTDIFIIGGGINGTAIAADAAGRGLSVTLCEKADLASATSSASTKLIHGGLRYLELYEFKLVKQALRERDILMRRAPNLVEPLEFVLPYQTHLRSYWLIRLGLFFYDYLFPKKRLPNSKAIRFKNDMRGNALLTHFTKGFSYFDCFTDDSRLVILNALLAKENKARILTYTEFLSAQRENNIWKIQLKNVHSNQIFYCYAKTLINAAGPWVKHVQALIKPHDLDFNIKLIKGSHFVIPKLYEGEFAYILQNSDARIIFTIPYQKKFTLIGTTDVSFKESFDSLKINEEEKNYLCHSIRHYFKKPISSVDIIWSYSGVRCLQGDKDAKKLSDVTRDYQLLLDQSNQLLTIIGGKLTTHRVVAEEVLQKLKIFFPDMKSSWTATHALPGCDFPEENYSLFLKQFRSEYIWLPSDVMERYAKNYGMRAYQLLKNIKCITDLGVDFGHGLYQKEVEFLMEHEWAKTAEDILWRRSKLGLFFSGEDIQKLKYWLEDF